jgi:hypothetical protein
MTNSNGNTHSPSSSSDAPPNSVPGTPERTVVDLQEGVLHKEVRKWVAAEEAAVEPLAEAAAEKDGARGAEIKLSQKRKWFLLFVFSVAQVSWRHQGAMGWSS